MFSNLRSYLAQSFAQSIPKQSPSSGSPGGSSSPLTSSGLGSLQKAGMTAAQYQQQLTAFGQQGTSLFSRQWQPTTTSTTSSFGTTTILQGSNWTNPTPVEKLKALQWQEQVGSFYRCPFCKQFSPDDALPKSLCGHADGCIFIEVILPQIAFLELKEAGGSGNDGG